MNCKLIFYISNNNGVLYGVNSTESFPSSTVFSLVLCFSFMSRNPRRERDLEGEDVRRNADGFDETRLGSATVSSLCRCISLNWSIVTFFVCSHWSFNTIK